jgi:hypothetical protein
MSEEYLEAERRSRTTALFFTSEWRNIYFGIGAIMKRLVIESFLLLLYFELVILLRDFRDLHRLVREAQVRSATPFGRRSSKDVCHAMDLACVFYFKRVRCLQRSAAATLLLRRYGWTAEMVIGAQQVPFKSHAWCEIDGLVVNDRPYMLEVYQVLARC